jgi:hypothetical protein
VVGLAAIPAWAAELRLTGFLDSAFPHFSSNISPPRTGGDSDVTLSNDQSTFGRTRGRMYFNVIGSDDLRAVFGFELDAIWGACPDGDMCFDRNTDMASNIETKWLYVDFRIPQLPIGNRIRLGGFPLQVTPLHGQTVLHGDMGGGDMLLTLTDKVAAHLYYVQFEEDTTAGVDRFPGMPLTNRFGEDYATGMTLRLKPLDGLDLHIPFVYGHLQIPSNTMTSQSAPGLLSPQYFTNVTTESRYYVGFDSRYRFGNMSIEPTFMYLFGTRNFCTPGSLVRTETDSEDFIPCTSPFGSRRDTSFSSFFGNLNVSYTTGPWLFQGKLAYASGNRANDDINNTGIGSRSNVHVYSHMNADGGPFYQEWFEIFGNSEVDGTSIDTFIRMGESGTFDRFGWQIVAGAAEYQLTDNLILEGAAGGFWSAKKTGCPAVLRQGSITGRCGDADDEDVNTPQGRPVYNFTSNSRYLGWEVAAGLRYTIMPGLTWTPRLAYADYGKGMDQNNRKASNAWVIANRMIYIF